jgi:HK97 family phage prohead protease
MKFRATEKFRNDTVITKAVEEEDKYLGYVSGWAATSEKDFYGDVIEDGALIKGAGQLLDVGTVFADHNYTLKNAIGKVVESSFKRNEQLSGIWVKVGITKTDPDLWTKINEGIIDSFSIGGIFNEVEYDEDMEVYKVKDMDILEVSIVGIPANSKAKIEDFGKKAMEFIKSLNHEDETVSNTEVKNMSGENEQPEWVEKIKALETQLAEMEKKQNTSTPDAKDEAITQLTDSVTKLASAMKPLLDSEARKRDLAERKSALAQAEQEKLEKMSFRQKQTYEMRRIIETLQDPTVDEVLLLGDVSPESFVPPIHERSIEEILEEKRRVGA